MSALAEQHERWVGAKGRLWPIRRKDLRYVRPQEPKAEPPVVVFAPFNFLKEPGPLALLKLVALKHGTTVAELRSHCRSLSVAAARHEAVWLVYTHCPFMSLTTTGRLFGGRDHSSAHHSIRVFEAKRRENANAR